MSLGYSGLPTLEYWQHHPAESTVEAVQTNYLDIGVQFGAGTEYRIWKQFWLGVDGRYHLASNQTNTVNNYGTVGAYVAIGF
jgi:hypothetical protein